MTEDAIRWASKSVQVKQAIDILQAHVESSTLSWWDRVCVRRAMRVMERTHRGMLALYKAARDRR